MEATYGVLVMLLAVVVSAFIARFTRLPVPLVQIALGAMVFYTDLVSVQLDSEVFFLLLLPPLLFLDGWRIPKDDLLRDAPTILTLALGLVVFTVLGVGVLIHYLIPAIPLTIAFALAAVISPTDAIAVSAIAARTPIPTRMKRILQGESLFNDASGLVCMRFAVAAALTGSFVFSSALVTFLWVALGGLIIGAAVTWLLITARFWTTQHIGEESGDQILLTLLIPFGVYLLAEYVYCSGILAAVAAGITMGFAPHSHWQAVTRIRRTAVWDMVLFSANGCIFVLLGEQIPSILSAAPRTVALTGHDNPWWLGIYVLIIVAALAALRFVWVGVSLKLLFRGLRVRGSILPSSYWRLITAMSLAGVRGAITLAGVLTLPLKMSDGSPFPGRDLAIFIAAGVIIVSLLLATVGLPHTLRGLDFADEPSRQAEENQVRLLAAEAAIRAVQDAAPAADAGRQAARRHNDAAAGIVALYSQRIDRFRVDVADVDTQVKLSDEAEHGLRLVALRAEREEILSAGAAAGIKEVALRDMLREVDLQEARHSHRLKVLDNQDA